MDSYLRRVFMLVLLTPLMHLVSSDLRGLGYVFIPDAETWEEANQCCRTCYSGLLTINGADYEANLDDEGWIGLNRTDGSWTWINGEPLDNLQWHKDEPKDEEDCAMWKYGSLKSEQCSSSKSFYCADQKLVLISEEKTWEEALQHCRDLRSPSHDMWYDLVTLEMHKDKTFAMEEAQKAATDEVWTGLRYLSSRWFWVGDGDKAIRHALPACPDQNNLCGAVSKTRRLQTRNCMERKNFFCQRRECD
ncbi:unnamed protein product [Arctogadus glacialis]